MSTIQFIGFRKAYVPNTEADHLDDIQKLILCLHNGWLNNTIYIRELPKFIELAVPISLTLDRQSIESLIKCDNILDGFRKRSFLIGEIQPGDLARYVLITIISMP